MMNRVLTASRTIDNDKFVEGVLLSSVTTIQEISDPALYSNSTVHSLVVELPT